VAGLYRLHRHGPGQLVAGSAASEREQMHDATTAPIEDGPVEDYLDLLLLTLGGSPRQVRHTLAEVEAHLHDLVAEEMAAGKSRPAAEAAAVARMGPGQAVTGRRAAFGRPTAALVRRGALAASLVGGVGLVAIGVSGAISWALAATRGGRFVTAPFPPGSYARGDCTRWLSGDPGTHNCVTAMIADHVGDIVVQGFAAGVVGLLALLAHAWMRRRWHDRGTLTALPIGSAEAAGGLLALLVAIAAAGTAVNTELVQRGQGAGQQFSIAIAALGAAIFFALRLHMAIRSRRTDPALAAAL
jgi:uncharacterized membrane protein YhaH (DUF805 family)